MILIPTRNQNTQQYENIDQQIISHIRYPVDGHPCQPLTGLAAMEGNKP